jgi:hypothetical protein
VSTWRKVEHAINPPYRRATLMGIAEALRVDADSIDLVLAGGEPVPTGRAGSVSDESDLRAAILAAPDLGRPRAHAGARTGTTQLLSMQRAVHLRAHLTVP